MRSAGDDDGTILLDLRTGRYSALNPVGGLVWSKLEEGWDRHAIVRDLQERFDDVPAKRIERDIEAILAELEDDRMIAPAESGGSGPVQASISPAGGLPEDGETLLAGEEDGSEAAGGGSGGLYWTAVAFLTLVYVDLLMRFSPFRRLYTFLGHCRSLPHPAGSATRQRICRAMDRAASAYFKRAWCLQRSVACVYLLRRRGIPAELVLGVRTFPFEAHAWAELAGRVLNDTTDYTGRFLVLDRV